MRKTVNCITIMILALLVSSCYYKSESQTPDAWNLTEQELDSISFSTSHHYTRNYNFVVKADSMPLIVQPPEEAINSLKTDSVEVYRHDRLVVADIRMLSNDKTDSVWVQLARDQSTIGWIHESKLLPSVVPDDPISQFIDTFSNIHLILFMIIISLMAAAYLIRRILRKGAKIVHFNDIPSLYPTLLTVIVSSSAAFYASIQLFAPETWRHFYYHPTLNPFTVPPILSIFLISVWAMIIVAISSAEDAIKNLRFYDAIVYLSGLAGICAIDYIVFSISTLYYVGYIFLAAYIFFALWRYYYYARYPYVCGNCGASIRRKGICPHCGAFNN